MLRRPGIEWVRVIEDKRSEFERRNVQLPVHVQDERSFRLRFEQLCETQNDYERPRRLSGLNFASISAFAMAVDATFCHAPPCSLAVLIFGGCFVAFEHIGQAGLQTNDMVNWLGQLNIAVPSLAADVPRFPHDLDVQAPLQAIFGAYMDCLISIIELINQPHISAADHQTYIEAKIQETAESLVLFKKQHSLILEKAQRADTRALSTSWSYLNKPSDVSGSFHSSQARFYPRRRLGGGSYGEVHEVYEQSTGTIYARKTIFLGNRGSNITEFVREVQQECATMRRLSHDHIVKIAFELKGQDNFYIFMRPVAEQDLRAYLSSCIRDGFPLDSVRSLLQWFGCLLDALQFAHLRNIFHQDIKPSNILVDADGGSRRIYLADFGLAKDFTSREVSTTANANVRGTPLYRAPEVRPNHARGQAADIFSLGCVFSEMLTVYCRKSLEAYEGFRSNDSDEVPLAFRAALSKVDIWLSTLEALEEGEISTMVYLIRRMIKEDSRTRMRAQEALKFLEGTQEANNLFCKDHWFELRNKLDPKHSFASSA